MDTIITYDIKRNHTEIKTELKSLGYKDAIDGSLRGTTTPITIQLPNTTFLKYGAAGTDAVLDEVVKAIDKHDGGLDRIFCVKLADPITWSGRS